MTHAKRIAALASAFTLALLSGSASVYANSKERIGIDNVDMCNESLRDPECTDDEAMGEAVGTEQETRYGLFSTDENTQDADDEAAEPANRSDNLDDGVGVYGN